MQLPHYIDYLFTREVEQSLDQHLKRMTSDEFERAGFKGPMGYAGVIIEALEYEDRGYQIAFRGVAAICVGAPSDYSATLSDPIRSIKIGFEGRVGELGPPLNQPPRFEKVWAEEQVFSE